MSIESDNERCIRGDAAASGHVSTGRSYCKAKRVEVQRLQTHLDKIRTGEDDEEDALLLALAQPVHNTDPLSFLCCCKFKRLGQSYVSDGVIKNRNGCKSDVMDVFVLSNALDSPRPT